MLPLRCDLSGNPTFQELLSRVRETALFAYAHQEIPFERLVEELRPERDPSLTPLVQVVVNFNQLSLSKRGDAPLGGLSSLALERSGEKRFPAHFDLILDLSEKSEGIFCSLVYAVELFDAATIRRLLESFDSLLAAVAENAELTLEKLGQQLEEERRRRQEDRRRAFREKRRQGPRRSLRGRLPGNSSGEGNDV